MLSKWRWLIPGTIIIALLAGLADSLLETPMYRASAQVENALQQENFTSNGERSGRQTAVRRDRA